MEKHLKNLAGIDGLSSLKEGVTHTIIGVDEYDMFTRVLVKIEKCLGPDGASYKSC